MKKLVIASLIVIGTVAVAATSVDAQVLGEQEQYQQAEQEATCTGSYGQETKCHLKQTVEQEQRQRILAENVIVRNGKVHTPVNTGLDSRTTAIIMAAGFLGLTSSIAFSKIK